MTFNDLDGHRTRFNDTKYRAVSATAELLVYLVCIGIVFVAGELCSAVEHRCYTSQNAKIQTIRVAKKCHSDAAAFKLYELLFSVIAPISAYPQVIFLVVRSYSVRSASSDLPLLCFPRWSSQNSVISHSCRAQLRDTARGGVSVCPSVRHTLALTQN